MSRPHSRQALADQDPVAVIQPHKIRNRSQGNQIEEARHDLWSAEAAAERGEKVERDPDAREALTGERIAGQVRVNDHVGGG